MGEPQGCLFKVTYNRSVKVRQVDSRITSNAGAVPVREMEQRLGLMADVAAEIHRRTGLEGTNLAAERMLRDVVGAGRR